MRLIDADKINPNDVIGGNSEFATDIKMAMQGLIDCQPTAYDVGKVVEQLEELWKEDVFGKTQMMEIVKAGGTNE